MCGVVCDGGLGGWCYCVGYLVDIGWCADFGCLRWSWFCALIWLAEWFCLVWGWYNMDFVVWLLWMVLVVVVGGGSLVGFLRFWWVCDDGSVCLRVWMVVGWFCVLIWYFLVGSFCGME